MEATVCSEMVKGRAWLVHQRCSATLSLKGASLLLTHYCLVLGSTVTARLAVPIAQSDSM